MAVRGAVRLSPDDVLTNPFLLVELLAVVEEADYRAAHPDRERQDFLE